MEHPGPDDQQRQDQRAERLRREARHRARQRVLIPVVALVAVAALATAFALRQGSAPPAVAPSESAVATPAAPAPTVAASASVETSPAVEQTAGPSTDTTAPTEEATVVPAVVAPKPLRPAPGVKTIVVDKSEQRVTLYKANGTPVDTFRCSSGVTYPRVGTYTVYGHRQQSWSIYEGDDSTFYYFTTFEKSDKGNNIGFHSIPQHPDGSLVGKLGVPVSHGCVRLAKDKAKFVYTWAVVGTRVVVKR